MGEEKVKSIAGLIISVPGILIHSFVFMKLWEWFVSGTFNIVELTLIQSMGLIIVADFVRSKIDWEDHFRKSPIDKFFVNIISHNLVEPFIILGVGYIITLFM